MKIENWNGKDVPTIIIKGTEWVLRVNEEGKYNTSDFMDLLEDLTDGKYVSATAVRNGKIKESLWGWHISDDGRYFKPTIWYEDEMLDTDNPIVFADLQKVCGWEPPKIRRAEKSDNIEFSQYIYIIGVHNSNFYKIGCSINPIERLQGLQTASPYNLNLIAMFESKNMFVDEKKIHQALDKHRVRGEWFNLIEPFETVMSVNEKHGLGLSVSKEIYKHIAH